MRAAAEELRKTGVKVGDAVSEALKSMEESELMRAVRSVSGWVGGNAADTMKFSVLTHVVPMVEVFPLEQAAVAFDRMMTAKVHFRAVLKVSEG